MKSLLKFLPVLMMAATATAQDEPVTPISDTQKEEIIQILKTLQESHNNRKNTLIKAGIAAISPAATNENAAMDLFERCYKTVEYDQNERRDPKDWRKWRTENKDGFTNAANKRALRYQARWALITLQAAMEPEENFDASKYAPQAIALLGEIIRDDKYVLLASKGPFNGSVITNQIGRLYELNACRPKGGWPDNILDMTRVIEGVVLAPARQKQDVAALRKGWGNLISLQRARNEMEAKAPSSVTNPTSGTSMNSMRGDRSDRMDRRRMMMGFDPNDVEDMAWRCEIDCYRCGDEYTASSNMINLIRNTKDARKQEQRINMMVAMLESNNQQQQQAGRNQTGFGGNNFGGPRANNAPAAVNNTPAPAASAPAPFVPAPAPAAPARPAGPPKPMVEEV